MEDPNAKQHVCTTDIIALAQVLVMYVNSNSASIGFRKGIHCSANEARLPSFHKGIRRSLNEACMLSSRMRVKSSAPQVIQWCLTVPRHACDVLEIANIVLDRCCDVRDACDTCASVSSLASRNVVKVVTQWIIHRDLHAVPSGFGLFTDIVMTCATSPRIEYVPVPHLVLLCLSAKLVAVPSKSIADIWNKITDGILEIIDGMCAADIVDRYAYVTIREFVVTCHVSLLDLIVHALRVVEHVTGVRHQNCVNEIRIALLYYGVTANQITNALINPPHELSNIEICRRLCMRLITSNIVLTDAQVAMTLPMYCMTCIGFDDALMCELIAKSAVCVDMNAIRKGIHCSANDWHDESGLFRVVSGKTRAAWPLLLFALLSSDDARDVYPVLYETLLQRLKDKLCSMQYTARTTYISHLRKSVARDAGEIYNVLAAASMFVATEDLQRVYAAEK